ncbi:MAG: hypothetical protein KME26_28695 [Oscillatoria princeps RMCB-10]|nr:hypothetical protein [Oscillatoria princeps RMCB-10]
MLRPAKTSAVRLGGGFPPESPYWLQMPAVPQARCLRLRLRRLIIERQDFL